MFDRLKTIVKLKNEKWQKINCPVCSQNNSKIILEHDRFLLKVDISICLECGLVYTGQNLKGKALMEFYQHHYRVLYEDIHEITDLYVYESRDKLKAAYRLLRIREVIDNITGVVEVGCGLGFFLYECSKSGVDSFLGFELGELFYNYGSKTLGLGPKIINDDPLAYTGELPKANVFALFHVLEHLEDPGLLLEWVKTKIGEGILVIEVPNIEGKWEQLGLINFHFGHRSYFSMPSLKNLLKLHGFSLVASQVEDDDGIYPGNIRVFARLQEDNSAVEKPSAGQLGKIVSKIAQTSNWSVKTGKPRALFRLLRP